MKVLSQPRRKPLELFGAALLLILLLSSCGTPLAGESWPGISTDGRYIYVAFQNHVFRVNPKTDQPGQPTTRSIDWIASPPEAKSNMYAPPAIADDGTVYVGSYDHKFYAFTIGNSLLKSWTTPTFTDKSVGGALINGDVVYVGLGDKGIAALDRKTGKNIWTQTYTNYGVWSTPVLVGDTLYFGSLDHNIYAADPKTGTMKWKVDLGGAIAGSPLYDNGMLYVGTFGNEFVAVSTETHDVKRRYTTDGWVWATPVLHNRTLFFGDLKGWVYALDADSFGVKWKINDPERPGAVRGRVAIAKMKDGKEIVIAGNENKFLRAFDLNTGDKVWAAGISAISADDQILSDLIVLGDEVIFSTLSQGQVVAAFNIETGQKSWSVNLQTEITRVQTATNVPVVYQTVEPNPVATGNAPAEPNATAAATSQQ